MRINCITSFWVWKAGLKKKLRRQNIKDLPGAIAAAESLVDFKMTQSTTDVPSTLKSKKGEKKGDQKRENRKDYANDKGKTPMKEGNKENKPKNKDGNSKDCWT